jgi:hypothetical protein
MPNMMLIHTMPETVPISQTEQVAEGVKALASVNAYRVGAWIQLYDKGDAAKIIGYKWVHPENPELPYYFPKTKIGVILLSQKNRYYPEGYACKQ